MENKLPLLLDSHYTCLIFPSVTMKFWSTQHVKITFWASLQILKNLAASLDVLRNMISLKLLLFFLTSNHIFNAFIIWSICALIFQALTELPTLVIAFKQSVECQKWSNWAHLSAWKSTVVLHVITLTLIQFLHNIDSLGTQLNFIHVNSLLKCPRPTYLRHNPFSY